MMAAMRVAMRRLRSCPQVAFGLLLSAALVVILVQLGDVRKAARLIVLFPPATAAQVLALALCYEAARFAQWVVFVRRLGVDAELSDLALSFSGSEAAKGLPGGSYAQSALLSRARQTPLAYSAAATTLIIWLEVAVAAVTLLLLGVPGWFWLRPACLALLAGMAAIVVLLPRTVAPARMPAWAAASPLGRWLTAQAALFLEGARTLLAPRTLLVGFALSWLYLLLASAGFTIILRGVGEPGATLHDGVVALMAGLAVGLVVPIPVDFGMVELGSLGSLVALGFGPGTALAAVILNRVAGMSVGLILVLAVGMATRDRWRAIVSPER